MLCVARTFLFALLQSDRTACGTKVGKKGDYVIRELGDWVIGLLSD